MTGGRVRRRRAIRRVALYGPYGHGNLGDAAIQESMIHAIRARVPDAEIVGVSLNPENTRAIHGIPAVGIRRQHQRAGSGTRAGGGSRRGPASSLRAGASAPVLGTLVQPVAKAVDACIGVARIARFLRSVDVLVVSGGGQISDDWGTPYEHPLTMLVWIAAARLVGTRVVVVSVGVGPFRAALSERLFRAALRLAHYRSYRDEESLRLARRWRFAAHDAYVPDLAFGLPIPPAPPPSPATGVVGLSPMAYFAPTDGAWPNRDRERYDRYLETMTAVAGALAASGRRTVWFTSQIRADRTAMDDLGRRVAASGVVAGDAVRAEPTTSLAHLLSQIAATDVVVTSRLHGVILAYCYGRPAVALSYDPKIPAVMRQLGLERHCLPIEEATAGAVLARLDEIARDPGLPDRIVRQVALHRLRLEEQFDRLFGPVASGGDAGRVGA